MKKSLNPKNDLSFPKIKEAFTVPLTIIFYCTKHRKNRENIFQKIFSVQINGA
jgi:hypothetical protein